MNVNMMKAVCLGGAALLFSVSAAWAQAPIIDLGDGQAARSGAGGAAPAVQPIGPEPASAGEFLYQLQALQQEVMTLRGEVERQGHELEQLRQQSLDRYIDLDRRIGNGGAAAESGAAAPAAPVPVARTSAPERSPAPTSSLSSRPGEYEAYKSAYAKVKAQEFAGAVTAFKNFLKQHPDGRYAPNAYYWLGELYLVQSPPQPDEAEAEFRRLLRDYPENAKVPDAMLKLGRLYYQRGEKDRSRQLLEQIIAEYRQHDSAAVSLAQQFLIENF